MNKIDREALLRRLSEEDTDLQLVVGADDLKSIERDIDDFFANEKMAQMIVTSPGRLLTGAIRFGLVVARDRGMSASISFDDQTPTLLVEKLRV
ncbi:Oidioi.mRNA.OKI2018_I69.chr1.g2266.t1.cds [Oikopleura dioica]|uniref:Oidioi.mRNA.OKI2018_I69.chr1.g2266.t1.cds n=1 Tax=Oikopleura dioica TaxID=34765 RepID=A0ABN7SVY7_OIKDI|nr:Oidioi.mRNA.OKI2018_I69.chr1.g2266.t1.cds [Oikopleura dioica]